MLLYVVPLCLPFLRATVAFLALCLAWQCPALSSAIKVLHNTLVDSKECIAVQATHTPYAFSSTHCVSSLQHTLVSSSRYAAAEDSKIWYFQCSFTNRYTFFPCAHKFPMARTLGDATRQVLADTNYQCSDREKLLKGLDLFCTLNRVQRLLLGKLNENVCRLNQRNTDQQTTFHLH